LTPQAPQLVASLRRSVHAPLQTFRPGRQLQVEPIQAWLELQAVPQAPQFVGLSVRSVQACCVVPHSVPDAAQLQAPLWHTSPVTQAVAQLPQCCGSVAGSVQLAVRPVPQLTLPAAQVQVPETQLSPAAQALMQLPQWLASVARFAQPMVAPQFTSPFGHWQAPATQVAPGPQRRPQPPQLSGSLCSFTQPRPVPQ
jgi:hypothetical protein